MEVPPTLDIFCLRFRPSNGTRALSTKTTPSAFSPPVFRSAVGSTFVSQHILKRMRIGARSSFRSPAPLSAGSADGLFRKGLPFSCRRGDVILRRVLGRRPRGTALNISGVKSEGSGRRQSMSAICCHTCHFPDCLNGFYTRADIL